MPNPIVEALLRPRQGGSIAGQPNPLTDAMGLNPAHSLKLPGPNPAAMIRQRGSLGAEAVTPPQPVEKTDDERTKPRTRDELIESIADWRRSIEDYEKRLAEAEARILKEADDDTLLRADKLFQSERKKVKAERDKLGKYADEVQKAMLSADKEQHAAVLAQIDMGKKSLFDVGLEKIGIAGGDSVLGETPVQNTMGTLLDLFPILTGQAAAMTAADAIGQAIAAPFESEDSALARAEANVEITRKAKEDPLLGSETLREMRLRQQNVHDKVGELAQRLGLTKNVEFIADKTGLANAFDVTPEKFGRGAGSLTHEILTDPSLVFSGGIGRASRLRQVEPVMRQAVDVTARSRALKEIGALGLLDDAGRQSVTQGEDLVAALLKRGVDADEAGTLAAKFDQTVVDIGTSLKAEKPLDLVSAIREEMGVVDDRLAKTAKWADKKDIGRLEIGSSLAEQAELNQRLLPWDKIAQKLDAMKGGVASRFPNASKWVADEWARERVLPWIAKTTRRLLVSDVPNDPDWLEAMYAARMASERDMTGAMNLAHELNENFVRKLNEGIPEAMRGVVRHRVRDVVEQVPPEQLKAFADSGITLDEYRQVFDEFGVHGKAVAELASEWGEGAELLRAWQNAKGLDVAKLADDTLGGWFGARFGDEFTGYLAKHPEMRDVLTGSKGEYAARHGLGPEQLQQTQARKMRGVTGEEREQFLREKLAAAGHKLPDDIRIFETDPEKIIEGDFLSAAKALDRMHHARQFMNMVGKDVQVSEDMLGAIATLDPAALKDVTRLKVELKKLGMMMPERSGLDVYQAAKVPLPDTVEDIARLASTAVSDSQMDTLGRVAPGITEAKRDAGRFMQALGALGQAIREVSAITRRAVLSTVPGVMKDTHGTQLYAALAGVKPGNIREADKLLGGFRNWMASRHASSPVVNQARAQGVLKTAAEIMGQKATGPSIFGTVGESLRDYGVLGSVARMFGKKAAQTTAKGTDALLMARQYQEEVARLGLYLNRLQQGWHSADAAKEVFKYLGNFTDMTRFEREVLQEALLFWSWQKKAVGGALRMILDRPFQAKLLSLYTAGNVAEYDVEDWAKRQGGWIIARGDNGEAYMLPTGSGSWFQPLNDLLQGEIVQGLSQGGLTGGAKGLAETAVRKSVPGVRMPIEALSNKDFFTGKKIFREDGVQERELSDRVPSAIAVPLRYLGLADAMGIEPVLDEDGNLVRYRTDNTGAKWLIQGMLPGASAVAGQSTGLADAIDPLRSQPASISLGQGVSTLSGMGIRQLREDEQRIIKRDLYRMRDKLREAVESYTGSPLTVDQFWNVQINPTSPSGRELMQLTANATSQDEKIAIVAAYDPELGMLWRAMEAYKNMLKEAAGIGESRFTYSKLGTPGVRNEETKTLLNLINDLDSGR